MRKLNGLAFKTLMEQERLLREAQRFLPEAFFPSEECARSIPSRLEARARMVKERRELLFTAFRIICEKDVALVYNGDPRLLINPDRLLAEIAESLGGLDIAMRGDPNWR